MNLNVAFLILGIVNPPVDLYLPDLPSYHYDQYLSIPSAKDATCGEGKHVVIEYSRDGAHMIIYCKDGEDPSP